MTGGNHRRGGVFQNDGIVPPVIQIFVHMARSLPFIVTCRLITPEGNLELQCLNPAGHLA
jgi:hypothetical protein